MTSRFSSIASHSKYLTSRLCHYRAVSSAVSRSSITYTSCRNFASNTTKSEQGNDTVVGLSKKGMVLPEFSGVRTRHGADSFYKKNPDMLPIISRRYTDEFGLFTRIGPKMFGVIPDVEKRAVMHPNTLFFKSGDVDVYLYPTSYPDLIDENANASSAMFDAITPDAVVVPLCAPRDNAKPIEFIFEEVDPEFLACDEFHPDGAVMVSSSVADYIESNQIFAQHAVAAGSSVTLGGRYEAVTYCNDIMKRVYDNAVVPPGLLSYDRYAASYPLQPDPHQPFNTVNKEITAAFEPALVYAAALRTAVEDQQELADADKTGSRRSVFAFVDSALLRHIENVYDLLPALSRADMVYLKQGYAAAYEAIHNESFKSFCDFDDIRVIAPKIITKDLPKGVLTNMPLFRSSELRNRVVTSKSTAMPWRNVHMLFSQIYGPVGSPESVCGACEFVFDSAGHYQAMCKSPKVVPAPFFGFFGHPEKRVCEKGEFIYEIGFVPELVRPPMPAETVEDRFERAAAAVETDKSSSSAPSRGKRGKRISDFVKPPATKPAAEASDSDVKPDAETKPATKPAAKPVEDDTDEVRAAQASMYAAAKDKADTVTTSEAEQRNLRMKPSSSSEHAPPSPPTSFGSEDADYTALMQASIDDLIPRSFVGMLAGQIKSTGLTRFPIQTQDAYRKFIQNSSFTLADLTDLMMMNEQESRELCSVLRRRRSGELSGFKAGLELMGIMSKVQKRLQDILSK